MLAIVAAVILAVGVVAVAIYVVANSPHKSTTADTALPKPIDGIGCNATEQTATHIHSHLDIIKDGQPLTIPANIGIPLDSAGNPRCFYWLHTHALTNDPSGTGQLSDGIIHVEAPVSHKDHQFVLGEFFAIWKEPLTSKNVAGVPIDDAHPLTVIVDGKPYTGDPAAIPLKDGELISLELGKQVPQPPFTDWPSGTTMPGTTPAPSASP